MNKAKIITEYWECGDKCCLNDRTILEIDGRVIKDDEGAVMTFSNPDEAMKELAKMLGVELEITEVWDHE